MIHVANACARWMPVRRWERREQESDATSQTRLEPHVGRLSSRGVRLDDANAADGRHYFAYGSNMHPRAMHGVCPSARALGRVELRGWRRIFRRVLTSEPAAGARITGVLWQLSAAELVDLDAFEDCPNLYGRIDVSLNQAGGSITDGFMYVMHPSRVPIAPPDDGYLQLVLEAADHWKIDRSEITTAAEEASESGKGKLDTIVLPWQDERWTKLRDA